MALGLGLWKEGLSDYGKEQGLKEDGGGMNGLGCCNKYDGLIKKYKCLSELNE